MGVWVDGNLGPLEDGFDVKGGLDDSWIQSCSKP